MICLFLLPLRQARYFVTITLTSMQCSPHLTEARPGMVFSRLKNSLKSNSPEVCSERTSARGTSWSAPDSWTTSGSSESPPLHSTVGEEDWKSMLINAPIQQQKHFLGVCICTIHAFFNRLWLLPGTLGPPLVILQDLVIKANELNGLWLTSGPTREPLWLLFSIGVISSSLTEHSFVSKVSLQ